MLSTTHRPKSKPKTRIGRCNIVDITIQYRMVLLLALLLPQILFLCRHRLEIRLKAQQKGQSNIKTSKATAGGKKRNNMNAMTMEKRGVNLVKMMRKKGMRVGIMKNQADKSTTATTTINAFTTKTTNDKKSANAKWIRVSQYDKDSYPSNCTHPWKHCCIGQGRKINDVKKKTGQLYQKWSDPSLQGIDKVLEFVANDRDKGNKSDDTCNLWFIGDSTTSDHIVAAMCDLSRHGYAMVECVQAMAGRPYIDDRKNCLAKNETVNSANTARDRGSIYPFPNFVMRRQVEQNWNDIPGRYPDYNIQGCSEVVLRYTDFTNTISNATRIANLLDDRNKLSRQFIDRGGAIMFNFGLHCDDNECIEDLMRNSFYPFYKWIKSEAVSGINSNKWKLVWKETEPQHFNTVGGRFHTSVFRPGKPCLMGKQYREKPLNNFRNIKTRAMIKELNLTEIPFIELFDKLSPRYDFHSDRSGDCTHFMYTPWRFDISWDGWVKGLQHLSLVN